MADTISVVTADDIKESAYSWPLQPGILNVPVCPNWFRIICLNLWTPQSKNCAFLHCSRLWSW